MTNYDDLVQVDVNWAARRLFVWSFGAAEVEDLSTFSFGLPGTQAPPLSSFLAIVS